MATPMIVLPIERLFKPSEGYTTVTGDDRELDEMLASRVADTLAPEKTFGEAPFAVSARWSYVPGHRPFNTAEEWPYELLSKLKSQEAFDEAMAAPAYRIMLDLRNALAHGGVTYLDKNGQNT
jgi:hypothetical protein